MSKPIIITATLAAWHHQSAYDTPAHLMEKIERGQYVDAISSLSFFGPPEREKFCDNLRVGEADITVRLLPRDEQTRIALSALNAKLESLRAAYMQRQQEILDEISKLQALTNEVEA